MNSKIEWCDASWNPWVGCQKVSPGCKNCYAERDMTRKPRWDNTWGDPSNTVRVKTSEANWQKPLGWNKQKWGQCQKCDWRGVVSNTVCPRCHEAGYLQPTRVRVFCASLADVFEDNDALIDWRLDLFKLIEKTPNLDWLVLTKRPEMARLFFGLRPDLLFDNVLPGVSVENQEYADKRLDDFKAIPAPFKFVSYEPALGQVDWTGWEFIDWLIAGGESGPKARPTHPKWIGDSRDWAVASGVSFYFKQWGEYSPELADAPVELLNEQGQKPGLAEYRRDHQSMYKVGKKAAGRLLDGQQWNEFPR